MPAQSERVLGQLVSALQQTAWAQLVDRAIQSCPIDTRRALYGNIVLSVRPPVRFALHELLDGILWWCITRGCVDSLQYQRADPTPEMQLGSPQCPSRGGPGI